MASFTAPFSLTATTSAVPAGRIADLLESFGYNAFPNGQDGSGGGYSQGTDTSAAHLTAIRYLTASTGMGLVVRLYEDGASASKQALWANALSASVPVKFSVCGGFAASVASLQTLVDGLTVGTVFAVEGVNEPNNISVHNAAITNDQCLSFQQAISSRYHSAYPIADASIVIRGTNFTTYPSDYLGTDKTAEIAACTWWNSHDYPNSGPPYSDMYLWGGGVHQASGWPLAGTVSEFHPTLFNNVTDEATGAYWTICALLAGHQYYSQQALIWFTLYDYAGFSPPCGLFVGFDPSNPRIAAKYIHALFQVCPDIGVSRHSFTTGVLDYTIAGLPIALTGQFASVATGGGQSASFEGTDGTFYLFVWNEQSALALGTTAAVTVTFANQRTRVVDYSITHNAIADAPVAIQTLTSVTTVHMNLTTEVRVLVITP